MNVGSYHIDQIIPVQYGMAHRARFDQGGSKARITVQRILRKPKQKRMEGDDKQVDFSKQFDDSIDDDSIIR
jgi:hypothetical protein